jgi:hypothetical protein
LETIMAQPFGNHPRPHLEPLEDRLMPSTMAGTYTDGTWRYDTAVGWSHISNLRSSFLDVDDAGNVYALYSSGNPTDGVWRWNAATASWAKLSNLLVDSFQVTADGVLYGDFGAQGVWRWSNSGWMKLSGLNPQGIAVSDSDAFFGAFNTGTQGTWRWTVSTGWSLLTGSLPSQVLADDAGNFIGLYTASGQQGTWRWSPSSGWARLSTAAPYVDDVSDNGTIFEYRSGSGIWRCAPGASSFSRIDSASTASFFGMLALPDGSLYVDRTLTGGTEGGYYWTPSLGGLGFFKIIADTTNISLPAVGKDSDLFFADGTAGASGTGHWSLQEPYDLLSNSRPFIRPRSQS